MEHKVKKAKDIDAGDIFFVDLEATGNKHLIGSLIDSLLTGNYCCFVADDKMADNEILVNGGNSVFLKKNEKLLVIGHYSEVVESVNKFKINSTI